MSAIIYPKVQDYIRGLLAPRQGLLAELEIQAEAEQVPIIQPEVAQLLTTLIASHRVKQVLELGTAIGYSTIWLAQAVGAEGHVVTIDLNVKRTAEAKVNFQKAGLAQRITIVEQDALQALTELEGTYDLIFIDAMKSSYPEFFHLCLPLLKAGGLLVADNVLLKGMVADDALVSKRHRLMVDKLREYLHLVTTHQQLVTTVLPIGDGVAVSYLQKGRD